MGEEEQKDPPPPSLRKPEPTPKPPSFNKPEPAPAMPPPSGNAGPPVIKVKTVRANSQEEAEDHELTHGVAAPMNPRLIAALIDGLVAIGLYLVVVMVLPDIFEKLALLVQAAYWVTRDSLPILNGQSIGKTAMKLKAVKKDGSSLVNDWQTAIVRNIPMVIPMVIPVFGLIEAIVLMSREGKPEQGLRLGDQWAKTKVIVWRPEEEGEGQEDEAQD